MLLVKAHYFCLDKWVSEEKQPELSTSISNQPISLFWFFFSVFFSDQSQNKLFCIMQPHLIQVRLWDPCEVCADFAYSDQTKL